MIKLGDRVAARPETINEGPIGGRLKEAVVVYIHPQYRFYSVEFRYEGGSFREGRFFSANERNALEFQKLMKETAPKNSAKKTPIQPPRYLIENDADDDDEIPDYEML